MPLRIIDLLSLFFLYNHSIIKITGRHLDGILTQATYKKVTCQWHYGYHDERDDLCFLHVYGINNESTFGVEAGRCFLIILLEDLMLSSTMCRGSLLHACSVIGISQRFPGISIPKESCDKPDKQQ